MFDALSSKISGVFGSLRNRGKITKSDIENTASEIRQALLEADVALPVVDQFIKTITAGSLELLPTLQSGVNQAQAIFDLVNKELTEILGGGARRVRYAKNPPTVIMLAGLQGAGKTTLAAKLAKFYKDQGDTPILVASDLQRPNAVNQLQVVGESVGVPVFAPEPGNGVGNAVQVARDGVAFAKSKLHNMVIIDTAGRLQNKADLMNELDKIRRVIEKQAAISEVLLVLDATTGQNGLTQAKAFAEVANVSGVVLTKLDGTAKGGIVYSIQRELEIPVKLVGVGEGIDDFAFFDAKEFANGLVS